MTLESRRVAEQIAQANRDLAEIAEQVEAGEIDAKTAARLGEKYRSERDALQEQLTGEVRNAPSHPEEVGAPLVTRRRMVGASVLIVASVVLAFVVVRTVGTGEPAAEGVASAVVAGDSVNLDDVTNEEMEAVVAENPDIAPMRLALADRYFAEGEFSNALTHYMYVLETLGVKDPSALANVGWMTYLSDVPDTAERFVEESLEIQPDGGIAFWYLANIRFRGLDDAAGAIEPLQLLLEYDTLPDDIRTAAQQMLSEIEASQ